MAYAKNTCKQEEIEILDESYKKLRNKVTGRIRLESKLSTIDQIKESGSPSEYWKVVKSVINPSNDTKLELVEDGVKISDEK